MSKTSSDKTPQEGSARCEFCTETKEYCLCGACPLCGKHYCSCDLSDTDEDGNDATQYDERPY